MKSKTSKKYMDMENAITKPVVLKRPWRGRYGLPAAWQIGDSLSVAPNVGGVRQARIRSANRRASCCGAPIDEQSGEKLLRCKIVYQPFGLVASWHNLVGLDLLLMEDVARRALSELAKAGVPVHARAHGGREDVSSARRSAERSDGAPAQPVPPRNKRRVYR
jgi:hypothetical protein